ncbi:large ribosomal subunit protein bL17m [Neocloeon triangulifer]|uniref:large ribosomal subunit protein bL17m n=1 Tax=Neocloeon triangulifer TaxID=2078957 RepID=UPI00286F2ECA|nr:large ribosomal subunit protein bL17m [Neocloeon triangulifer]
MNQADVTKLVSALRINVLPKHRRLSNPDGPKGRVLKIQKTVTALFKHERIEVNRNRADEARGYAERLISEAIRHGDRHNATMEMADFWLLEKQLVHKLFKVLVPRFESYNISYTRCVPLASSYPSKGFDQFEKSLLELRGNPYPPLMPKDSQNHHLLHNILLEEARKEMRQTQYLETAKNIGKEDASAWVVKDKESSGTEPKE